MKEEEKSERGRKGRAARVIVKNSSISARYECFWPRRPLTNMRTQKMQALKGAEARERQLATNFFLEASDTSSLFRQHS